ncbi:MAG: hypothetical protein Q8P35_00050 [Candidatus Yanofskybacteria bacterium]|nr:hypothetical protein [Candidatus Yanofskybacteria bacterium]
MNQLLSYPLKRMAVTGLVLFMLALNWSAMRHIIAGSSSSLEYGFVFSSSCVLAALIVKENKI